MKDLTDRSNSEFAKISLEKFVQKEMADTFLHMPVFSLIRTKKHDVLLLLNSRRYGHYTDMKTV